MGTRINVLLDHDLTDYLDREAVLARLAAALPATLAVRDYWQSVDPHSPPDNLAAWWAAPVSPRSPDLNRYEAPGSLFLSFTNQAARIHTGGRWRGFLSIEPLRLIYLAAFRQIACVLGSGFLALYADSCEVDDLFWSGSSQGQCIELMQRMWGSPQKSVETIEPWIVAAAERTVPLVWFLESSQVIAESGRRTSA